MITAAETSAQQPGRAGVTEPAGERFDPNASQCERCGGFLVPHHCLDVEGSSTGELWCWTLRCIQCGEVIDPVILKNRRRSPDYGTDQATVSSS